MDWHVLQKPPAGCIAWLWKYRPSQIHTIDRWHFEQQALDREVDACFDRDRVSSAGQATQSVAVGLKGPPFPKLHNALSDASVVAATLAVDLVDERRHVASDIIVLGSEFVRFLQLAGVDQIDERLCQVGGFG